jgi:hypothetical protein
VTEYVVQAGPLRTFEALYDSRSGRTRQVADFHTIELVCRDQSRTGALAELARSPDREMRFVASFLKAVLKDPRVVFGMRDANQGRAWLLGCKLKGQEKRRWSLMKYGLSDDDLVLMEIRDLAADLALLREFTPPSSGEMFFHLTTGTFDLFDIYWQRAARSSTKPGEDRFRRDVAALAHEARVTLLQDPSGSFTVILHPQVADIQEVERRISAAGKEAGLQIVFAPGLFG